jgi:hypothetical protein
MSFSSDEDTRVLLIMHSGSNSSIHLALEASHRHILPQDDVESLSQLRCRCLSEFFDSGIVL